MSTSDKESRALIQHHNVVEVSYNSQTAVDSKHCLIIHYQALNKNDSKALAPTALAAKQALGKKRITVLADKAYHSGEQLSECLDNSIITIVAYKEPARGAVPTAAYYLEQFLYDEKKDHYICPKGEILSSNGSWYDKHKVSWEKKNASPYMVKHYKSKACLSCSVKALCTTNKAGRLIERSEHAAVIKSNNLRLIRQKEVYRKRQAIVEHPFGTIKRSWGYTYTLMKGLKKVDGELGLIFTCYNLRRAVSILSVPKLLKLLKNNKKWLLAASPSLSAIYQRLFKQLSVFKLDNRQLRWSA